MNYVIYLDRYLYLKNRKDLISHIFSTIVNNSKNLLIKNKLMIWEHSIHRLKKILKKAVFTLKYQ